jgi:hypothetical protein
MAVYVYRDGRMVDRDTGEPMVSGPWVPVAPRVVPDIAPYRSPVTGEYIGGRRAKRADLDRHNCVDASELPSPTGGKIKSRRILEKYNLPETVLHEASR